MFQRIIKTALILSLASLMGCYSTATSRSNQAYYRQYCAECSQPSVTTCCTANSMNSSGCSRCNYNYNRVDYQSNGYTNTYYIYPNTAY